MYKMFRISNTAEIYLLFSTFILLCSLKSIHNAEIPVVSSPPSMKKQPPHEQLYRVAVTQDEKDNSFMLECEAEGNPEPEYRWTKNGINFEYAAYDKRISQQPKRGTLVFSKPEDIDEGVYQCFATNKYGTSVSNTVFLRKAGETNITEPPENFEVAAGSSATFRCKAESDSSLNLTIDWLFNGQLIDFEQDPRMVQASDHSLTITKTLELDSGVFTCVARTKLDKDESQAILTVQDVPNPPRIVSVTCNGFLASIVWEPMGDRRAPILSYSIQYNTSFSPATWEDAYKNITADDTTYKIELSPWANYTFRVTARNKIGASEPSSPSEHCATPEDVPYKNPDNVVGKGTHPDNLVISWTPMPLIEHNAPEFFYKVYWKSDEDPQSSWNQENITEWRKNQLVIDNQPTFKRYRIKVEAHNRRGQSSEPAIEVFGYSGEDVPREAPLNFGLRYIQMDGKRAFFAWDPVSPDSLMGHFRGYKLQSWTADESEEDMREFVVPSNVTQALASIFKPNSRNIVRVCAYNDVYNGPPSDAIDFWTPEGTPGPVAYFEAIPMGASALYLVWKRPLEPNGRITGFRIYFREVNDTDQGTSIKRQPIYRQPGATRAKLVGLTPNTKYRVIIHATTRVGEGDPYSIEVKTNKEQVPDVPNFVWSQLPVENSKAGVLVTWIPTVEGHPGSYFYVQYRRKGENHWNQTATEVNDDSVIVKGLEIGILYEIRVVAVDGHFETPSKIEEIGTSGLDLKLMQFKEKVRTSLTSNFKGQESATDSLADYGEGEIGKFGENGSFTGQYEKETTSPSDLATFV